MPEILYQYGSNNRCFNILEKKAIRLSDIRKSNDYDELLIIYPHIFSEILSQYNDAQFPFKYDGLEGIPAMQRLISTTKEMLDDDIITGSFSNFVTCFSEEPDTLSQWRGYANDGKGCCIGFSINDLRDYCNQTNGVVCLEKIVYVNKDQLQNVIKQEAESILVFLQYMRKWIVDEITFDDNDENTDGLLAFNFHNVIEATLTNSLKYKSIGFKEEKEWRLFLAKQPTKKPAWIFYQNQHMVMEKHLSETMAFLHNKIEFNITEDNITPYIPINFSEFKNTPIKEIWIGPKSKISESDLALYLAKHRYTDVEIKFSEISYR